MDVRCVGEGCVDAVEGFVVVAVIRSKERK